MSKGYVYVLSNPSMPGLIKVGRSKHGGRQRADELYQTGVATPFSLEFEIYADDASSVESAVHKSLSQYRENAGREFFRCTVAIAAKWISHHGLAGLGLSVIDSNVYVAVEYAECWGRALNKPAKIVADSMPCINKDAMAFAIISFEEAMEARKRKAG